MMIAPFASILSAFEGIEAIFLSAALARRGALA